MESPKIQVPGVSDNDILTELESLRKWYGDYKGKKEVLIVDDIHKIDGQKIIASSTIENMERSIKDGSITKLREECDYIIRKGHRRMEPVTAREMPGRNEPCPCGSGKKYKRCCINKQ